MFLLNPFLYELFYLLVLIVNIIIIGSNDSMNKNIRSRDEITAVGWITDWCCKFEAINGVGLKFW